MSALSTSKIESSLCKKGFKFDKQKTDSIGHRAFYLYDLNGNKTCIFTYISHSHDTIYDELIKRMYKQLHLDKKTFIKMIDCFVDHEGYIKILNKNRVIY